MRSLYALFAIAFLATVLPSPAATVRLGKHTVTGDGSFEQGGGHAMLNRATIQPLGGVFALTVSGRMGWVITGRWAWQGAGMALTVGNMNNAPASGTGEVKLDASGRIASAKIEGKSGGENFKLRFRAGDEAPLPQNAPAPAATPAPRLPAPTPKPTPVIAKPRATPAPKQPAPKPTPAIAKPRATPAPKMPAPKPTPAIVKARATPKPKQPAPVPAPVSSSKRTPIVEQTSVDSSRGGTGLARGGGRTMVSLTLASVRLHHDGRAFVRFSGSKGEFNFRGRWSGQAGGKARLTLKPERAGSAGSLTGTVVLDAAHRQYQHIMLDGRLDGQAVDIWFGATQ